MKATDEKRRFMEVYGTLGSDGVGFLKAYIEGKHGDASESSRACAVYGLATAGGSAARTALKKLLAGSEGLTRYAASEAISMLDGRADDSASG
jgi:hypothetical protein